MKTVLCIGHATYDITYMLESFPEENSKYRFQDVIECGGGPASNAAYLLAKWGEDVSFAGIVGNDIYGHRILEEFEEIGVNTDYLELDKTSRTDVSCILVNKQNGSRTVLTALSNMSGMNPVDFNGLSPDAILLDGTEPDLATSAVHESNGAVSILDAGKFLPDVVSLCDEVDYAVCSRDFAESYAGEKMNLGDSQSIERVFSKLSHDFSSTVVITIGEYGCIYQEEKNAPIKVMPTYKVEAVDTTGAGDIFHGAFTYAIVNNYPLKEALKIANITAALSVTRAGGRNSMPPLSAVMKIYDRKHIS